MRLLSLSALFVFLFLVHSDAQKPAYTPDWESLDTRPVPTWWQDAKFGIFIHWGVYSVPGFTKKGAYAEWYQHSLENNNHGGLVRQYHKTNFGDKSYYDLAERFTADLYEPDEWARLFEDAGARYVVLTSKHHDGFCLWPNETASETWGFPWSSDKVGPRRDLIGDLFESLSKTSVRPGLYYSLYEWFNPLWLENKEKYASEHAMPQLYELINRYKPQVIWSDGDWDATPEQWKSPEFLAWLYNESPVRDSVVANDRWGSGVRFHHSGIYTPEYQPDLDFEDHPWEESRGMGFSYGYNRAEDAWDYNSTQSLVLHLIDKVSRGGNFLLDIGPDEHGNIPPIMQDRLLEIGQWLKVNGEAIYGTRRWRTASQWSEGRRDWKAAQEEGWKTGGDALLKQTVDPDPGFAVKELFFTWNEQSKSLCAIFPTWPSNRKITVKGLQLPENAAATLLATGQKLQMTRADGNVVIQLPEYDPNKIKTGYAWVVKISGVPEFISKPVITTEYDAATVKPIVTLGCKTPGVTLRYTTDGTAPGEKSPVYVKGIRPDSACTIRVRAFKSGCITSEEVSAEVFTYPLMPSMDMFRAPERGLNMRVTTVNDKYSTTTIQKGTIEKTAVVNEIALDTLCNGKCGMIWKGFINIAQTGGYQFSLESDDGSRLYLDNELIVDNEGDHGMEKKTGIANLQKGWHSIRILYYNAGGGFGLKAQFGKPGGEMGPLTGLGH
jgi:alpha-L-fucosidase